MILIGFSGLVLKKWLSNTISDTIYSYLGNFTVSYAIFFLPKIASENRINSLISALIALTIVESFELTNGFGIMANVYDPFDYLANALGISLAYIIDMISTWIILGRKAEQK
jgi:hypothetical protein